MVGHPDDPELRVSHETIYQSLFVQAQGVLRRELTRYLRTGRSQLRDSPPEVEDRAVPDHWEGDLILGIARRVLTLPEQLRHTHPGSRQGDGGARASASIRGSMSNLCDPRSPWQRATSENTNGLLRQCFPKGTDLAVHG